MLLMTVNSREQFPLTPAMRLQSQSSVTEPFAAGSLLLFSRCALRRGGTARDSLSQLHVKCPFPAELRKGAATQHNRMTKFASLKLYPTITNQS